MEPKQFEITNMSPINTDINVLVKIIMEEKKKEDDKNIWGNSIYKYLPFLQANNVGKVGEILIHNLCINNQINSTIDGTKTKMSGGGDGTINNKTVEIKTALLGSNKSTFQHELGEHPWNAIYMIFIDIAPDNVYITIFKNFTEEQYKTKKFKCNPYFPTKSITRRKGVGNFKLDTSININDKNIKNGYSIKLGDINIKQYINNKIVL